MKKMPNTCTPLLATLVFAWPAATARADTTPMDAEIPETAAFTIACRVPEANRFPNTGDTVYHYTAYLPAGYKAAGRPHPVLWICSPQGNASPLWYKDVLDREQMIGVALVESKNGPMQTVLENHYAAMADALQRFRVAPGFMVATGFSGAGYASLAFAESQFFGGVLQHGAAPIGLNGNQIVQPAIAKGNPTCGVYGVFGITDGANPGVLYAPQILPETMPRRFSLQSGGHHQAQPGAFGDGMDFLLDEMHARRPPPNDAAPAQYAARFRLLLARAKASEGIAKHEALEAASRIVLGRKFATEKPYTEDKALQADIAEASRQYQAVSKTPGIKNEIDARDAYQKIRDAEDAGWAGNIRDLGAFAKAQAVEYGAVAQKFPGAHYGKKAADRAAWLAKGVD